MGLPFSLSYSAFHNHLLHSTTKLQKTCRGFTHPFSSASSMPSQVWVLLHIYLLSYEIQKLSNTNTTCIQRTHWMYCRQWASCLDGCSSEVYGLLLQHLQLRLSMCLLWLLYGGASMQKLQTTWWDSTHELVNQVRIAKRHTGWQTMAKSLVSRQYHQLYHGRHYIFSYVSGWFSIRWCWFAISMAWYECADFRSLPSVYQLGGVYDWDI